VESREQQAAYVLLERGSTVENVARVLRIGVRKEIDGSYLPRKVNSRSLFSQNRRQIASQERA
jgi:hypothetical protein